MHTCRLCAHLGGPRAVAAEYNGLPANVLSLSQRAFIGQPHPTTSHQPCNHKGGWFFGRTVHPDGFALTETHAPRPGIPLKRQQILWIFRDGFGIMDQSAG